MWAIRDFAGRYFSEGGWADRTRDALLYATCDEAERSMQENGIVDAYCIFAGGDGDWCQTCAKWDADHGKCPAFLGYPARELCLGYEYDGRAEEQRGSEEVLGKYNKDGTVRRICLNCSHYDPMGVKCQIMPSYDNFTTYDSSCESFSAKPGGPPQTADDATDTRYRHGSLECIDAIRAALTPEEFRGFCKGNVMKYVWRERYKGGDCDLDKARDYVGYAVAGDIYGEL